MRRFLGFAVTAAFLAGCGERGGQHAFSPYEHGGGGTFESHGGGSFEPRGGGGSSFEHHESSSSSYESPRSSSSSFHESRPSDDPARAIAHAAVAAATDVAAAVTPGGDSDGSGDSADPPPRLRPDGEPREPVALDEVRALYAIRTTDLSECKYHGAPIGFGRARVTFRADGRVTQVAIESPQNLSGDAANCIGDRLGEAIAPSFTGPPVDLYGTFYVR